ncbi:MAG: patatin-like phospholipase family protein [Clostridium sp.]
MAKLGLVLEGGGTRGAYTSGVLDCFMEKNFYTDYVIGVSAGACNGAFYLSRQIQGSKKITIDILDDLKYISYKNFIKNKNIIQMDLMFKKIPNHYGFFDYKTFDESSSQLVIVATDCDTGKPVYFTKYRNEDIWDICKASSSLPFVCPIVEFGGKRLLDGGVSDSIPVKKAIEDGCDKVILILTRDKTYRKKQLKAKLLMEKVYREYPKLKEAILNRYETYNSTLEYIRKLEQEGKVFVIRPEHPIEIGRTEQHKEKLEKVYNLGYEDGEKYLEEIRKWLSKSDLDR